MRNVAVGFYLEMNCCPMMMMMKWMSTNSISLTTVPSWMVALGIDGNSAVFGNKRNNKPFLFYEFWLTDRLTNIFYLNQLFIRWSSISCHRRQSGEYLLLLKLYFCKEVIDFCFNLDESKRPNKRQNWEIVYLKELCQTLAGECVFRTFGSMNHGQVWVRNDRLWVI